MPPKFTLCVRGLPTMHERINWNSDGLSEAQSRLVGKLLTVKVMTFTGACELLNRKASSAGSSSAAGREGKRRKTRTVEVGDMDAEIVRICKELGNSDVRVVGQYNKWNKEKNVCIAKRKGWCFEWDVNEEADTELYRSMLFDAVAKVLMECEGSGSPSALKSGVGKLLKMPVKEVGEFIDEAVRGKWIEKGTLAGRRTEQIWFGTRTLVEHPKVKKWYAEVRGKDSDFEESDRSGDRLCV